MSRPRIYLNAFHMNCVVHHSAGLWPHPEDRTPVLYQAGASPRGQAFAGRHAECVFTLGPSPQVVGRYVQDLRSQAALAGRDPLST